MKFINQNKRIIRIPKGISRFSRYKVITFLEKMKLDIASACVEIQLILTKEMPTVSRLFTIIKN
jgi:hypothetical protein